jgi:uncharacterized protein
MTIAAPRLIAIGGLSGAGKSTLAAALAPVLGAVWLRSDVERKRLFGVSETTRLGAEAYGRDVTARVYARLSEAAAAHLFYGRDILVDAVFQRQDERAAIEAVAAHHGARFCGLWLEAEHGLRRTRVAERTDDASDATPAIVDLQATRDAGLITWDRLAAGDAPAAVLAAALAVLTAPRP